MIPTTIKIGKARDINPPTTIRMRLIGNSTMVKMNFEIPQAALMPKNNNLPNTNNIKIENNKVFSKFEPVKGQSMCGWDRMDEYIIEHYNRRVDRMVEKPCFIYSQENRNSEDELVELLELANNGYHLIFVTSNKDLILNYNKCDNIRFLYKEKNEIVQKIQAEAIKNNFIDFVNYK